ncbi:hypothetical protein GCM10010329_17480 [Streptomyces spiroverticillatus]|uniref:Histidine kinase/HSP90-like ATPase domain-containing protein n=1 Tax=Streptomyces finlayi TaxID=67296 RepID=A0A919C7Z9_9ACTN|nr:hypothetical protein GCM10010329_17480 [Streptomyces spiroverticillatus]GHC82047.1 hypothetical protein GCM10010334_09960 [Streptomyces finlayi]
MTIAALAPSAPPPEPGSYRMTGPSRPTTPRVAREWVVLLCNLAGFTHLVDDARLCLSEVVTNVLLHTASPLVVVDATLRERDLVICVHDSSPVRTLVPSSHFSEEERGRGLSLLDSLAEEWGTTFYGGAFGCTSKAVWFRLHEFERSVA